MEIRELPSVDSPVISVSTSYTGASPETVDREITAVIESAAGRVPGVKAISSSSSFGRSRVTVDFREDVDLDVAASDMRDAISRVSRDLPDDADDPRIVKADNDAQAILRVAITSDRLSAEQMTEIVENQVVDNFTAVNGVADVQVYGDRDQVFRIDIDQARLASRGLSIGDLAQALGNAAFDTPAGSLSSDTQDLAVQRNLYPANARAVRAIGDQGANAHWRCGIGDPRCRHRRELSARQRTNRYRSRYRTPGRFQHARHLT